MNHHLIDSFTMSKYSESSDKSAIYPKSASHSKNIHKNIPKPIVYDQEAARKSIRDIRHKTKSIVFK